MNARRCFCCTRDGFLRLATNKAGSCKYCINNYNHTYAQISDFSALPYQADLQSCDTGRRNCFPNFLTVFMSFCLEKLYGYESANFRIGDNRISYSNQYGWINYNTGFVLIYLLRIYATAIHLLIHDTYPSSSNSIFPNKTTLISPKCLEMTFCAPHFCFDSSNSLIFQTK